jgi:hypothetical protein
MLYRDLVEVMSQILPGHLRTKTNALTLHQRAQCQFAEYS